MKQICLVRHAKTEHESDTGIDFDRKLTRSGEHHAAELGKFLSNSFSKPDLMITSEAARAARTAYLLARELDYPVDQIVHERGLYLATPESMFAQLSRSDDRFSRVILVVHNPGMAMLASILAQQSHSHFPTSSAVAFRFEIDNWLKIRNTAADLIFSHIRTKE